VGDGAAVHASANDLYSRSLLFMPIISKPSGYWDILTNLNVEWTDGMIQGSQMRFNKTLTGCDLVLAISCDGWPSCAREWITRDRNWPQKDLITKIIDDGFHIVPKSSTEGDFRLSFSYAETTLIASLTEFQHKILLSFKAVVKYHQNTWSPNIKEILTTYHLKTIAFWYFENKSQDSFTEKTVATHLIILLQELAKSLRNRELPMYFMPKVNLFRNAENPEEAIDIAEQMELLSNDFARLIDGIENITGSNNRNDANKSTLVKSIMGIPTTIYNKILTLF
jgi:thiol-disulfide isomerase/thioredoxin